MFSFTVRAIFAAAFVCAALPVCAADTWKPTKPVTFIIGNAAGGTGDRTAREMQRVIQAHKLVEVPIVIVNRPGGSGTVSLNQLRASPGDGHVLLLIAGATLTAQLAGLTPYGYADFTPVALLMEEYFGINVRPDSAVQSATDMLNRLRKAPDALSFGTAALAGNNYI